MGGKARRHGGTKARRGGAESALRSGPSVPPCLRASVPSPSLDRDRGWVVVDGRVLHVQRLERLGDDAGDEEVAEPAVATTVTVMATVTAEAMMTMTTTMMTMITIEPFL